MDTLNFIQSLFHPMVFSPADEGGSGEGEGAADGEADGKGEAEGDGGGKQSILDLADKSKAKDGENGDGEGEKWKAPDDVPEHLRGESADETLARLTKAYTGARKELSQKGKSSLEGTVPETPDGYEFKPDGKDDKIAEELNSEASKPIVDGFRKAAHALGIPDQAFTTLMREGLKSVEEETGLVFGQSTEEAQEINSKAEMAALTKEVGDKQAAEIVNTVAVFAEKLADMGVIKDEADVDEFAQMVGTARGARIFHRMLVGYLGEKPVPPGDGGEGQMTKLEAQAKYNEALSMKDGPEKEFAVAEALKVMSKTFGEHETGSIKSSVMG